MTTLSDVPDAPLLDSNRVSLTSGFPLADLPGATAALEAFFGADPDSGRFRCPIPGHDHLATLEVPPNDPAGDVRLVCDGDGSWRSLGEVRASMGYNRDCTGRPYGAGGLTNKQAWVWTLRLLWDAKVLWVPAGVREETLVLPPAVRKVWEGFRLLAALREPNGGLVEMPYSNRFAAAWCEVSFREARTAIAYLRSQRMLVQVGELSSGARKTPLYQAGTAPDTAEICRRRVVTSSCRGNNRSPTRDAAPPGDVGANARVPSSAEPTHSSAASSPSMSTTQPHGVSPPRSNNVARTPSEATQLALSV